MADHDLVTELGNSSAFVRNLVQQLIDDNQHLGERINSYKYLLQSVKGLEREAVHELLVTGYTTLAAQHKRLIRARNEQAVRIGELEDQADNLRLDIMQRDCLITTLQEGST